MVIPKKVIQLWRCVVISPRLNLDASVDGEKEPIPPAVRGSTGERTRGTTRKLPVEVFRTLNFLLDGNMMEIPSKYLDLPMVVCKKFVPKFTKKNSPKGRVFTYLEDPGMSQHVFF